MRSRAAGRACSPSCARPDAPRSRDAPPRYLLSTMALMLARGKALNLAIYTSYGGEADLEWIRGTTLRWIDELQRLNLR